MFEHTLFHKGLEVRNDQPNFVPHAVPSPDGLALMLAVVVAYAVSHVFILAVRSTSKKKTWKCDECESVMTTDQKACPTCVYDESLL